MKIKKILLYLAGWMFVVVGSSFLSAYTEPVIFKDEFPTLDSLLPVIGLVITVCGVDLLVYVKSDKSEKVIDPNKNYRFISKGEENNCAIVTLHNPDEKAFLVKKIAKNNFPPDIKPNESVPGLWFTSINWEASKN